MLKPVEASAQWTFASIRSSSIGAEGGDTVGTGSEGDWRNSLFGCYNNCSLCCGVLWCNPCAVGQLNTIRTRNVYLFGIRYARTAVVLIALTILGGWYWPDENGVENTTMASIRMIAEAILFALTFYILYTTRRYYREKLDMRMNTKARDCCITCFCSACSTCQMLAEEDEIVDKGYYPLADYGVDV